MEMVMGLLLLSVLVIGLIYRSYRRQVRAICRQLAFAREQETNLRLRSGLPQRELDELIDAINVLLDGTRDAKRSAEKSSSLLKEMIANLSHDIRTPLTSLDGYFQLLASSPAPEETERYLRIIRERIDSLKGMLEELFGYAKLQDAALTFETSRFDVARLISETVLSFYDDFVARGITPTIEFPEEEILIESNPDAIRRILQNLLKNALVHGKSRIDLSLHRSDDGWSFECVNDVEDPERIDVEQVFRRFYKADTARSRSSTGLGLAIAQTLAQRLELQIRATLDADRFGVRIGSARAAEADGEPYRPARSVSAGKK